MAEIQYHTQHMTTDYHTKRCVSC